MGGWISNSAEPEPSHAGNARKSHNTAISGENLGSAARRELSAALRDLSIPLSKEFSVSDARKTQKWVTPGDPHPALAAATDG